MACHRLTNCPLVFFFPFYVLFFLLCFLLSTFNDTYGDGREKSFGGLGVLEDLLGQATESTMMGFTQAQFVLEAWKCWKISTAPGLELRMQRLSLIRGIAIPE